ncbi:MAG TPA: hypothetical protein VGF18_04485 [Candidatus Tumulicola sp.]|jgi:hypothetical protein
MLFLWFFHACRRGSPRFLMVADHVNYLTFEDPGAVNTVRRALKLAEAGDLHGAAEAAGVDPAHAQVVSDALRRGMRFSLGAEIDNDPRARPDAQNIIDAMRPDGLIRCVSFITIEHPEKGPDFAWSFDDEEFASVHESFGAEPLWELYVAKLLDDLEKLPANVAGNFYAPARLGGWPALERLEAYEDRFLQICHARKLAIEINTRFLYRETSDERKREYLEANMRLARKAQALGVGIAIGSDAHSPKDQGHHFDTVLRMLDDAGINELVFPVAGRLARVALRATREHLEAQARTTEKSVPGSSISGLGRAELGLPEHVETRREGSSTSRETAAKRRAGGPARTTKKPAAGSAKSSSKSSSKRSADSSESSTQAKAARAESPAEENAAETPPAKPAKAPKPPAKAKAEPKASAVKAPAMKTAPAKAAAAKSAPAKSTPAKSAAPKPAEPKAEAKATSKTKAAAAAAPKAKPAAKKTKPPEKPKAAAPARKKAAVKKAPAKAPARAGVAAKKTAKKTPAKPAARATSRAAKPAVKAAPAKKKTVKKSSKAATPHGVKKRPAPKRR